MSPSPGDPLESVNPLEAVDPLEVDARGLRCPLPVIRLAEAARDAPAGTCIVLLTTDPAARHDVPAWCRMRGHDMREMTQASDPAAGPSVPVAVTPDPGAGTAQPSYLRFVVVL